MPLQPHCESTLSTARYGVLWPWLGASLLAVTGCTQQDVTFCRTASCADRVITEIENASKSVHTAIYALTNDEIVTALEEAAARPGVDVRVVAERSQTDSAVMNSLISAGIPALYADKRSCSCGNVAQGIMHHKFTVIDSRIVLTGSYNYSCSAENCSDEHIVMMIDSRVAESFESEFTYLYESGEQP